MIPAILFFSGLAVVCGLLLNRYATAATEGGDSVARIDALLPQTQCGRCGYPGCRPYAEAIARGDARINQCPPGGDLVIRQLSELMGVESLRLDPDYGEEQPPTLAVIDESACIGCTKCIQACPVDAIIGAAKKMHTVIASECTGCELCIPPCPVDCIDMLPDRVDIRAWVWPKPEQTVVP